MILNGKGWHYITLKKLSVLLRGITCKHHGNFYFLNCLHSFRTEYKLKLPKKVCENKYFYTIVISSEETKILEFNQYQNSDKVSFLIYLYRECLIEKIDGYKNNPENSATIKLGKHIPSDFSVSTISSFKSIENELDVYRSKDCIEKFCEYLKEHAMDIINFRKKTMKLLIEKRQESYEDAKICYIFKQKSENIYVKDINYVKVGDHCKHYRGI